MEMPKNAIWSIYQAESRAPEFFSAGNKRFFNSRIGSSLYMGKGKSFFTTSEKFTSWSNPSYSLPRLYTVRVIDWETAQIEDLNGFQAYKTSSAAIKAARQAAIESRG
jgi:hypothetical protein